MEGQTKRLRSIYCPLDTCGGVIESFSKSEAAGRRVTRNWHVQKLAVPVLRETEEHTTLGIPEKTGNKLQQIIIAGQVEHVVHMRLSTQRSRNISVILDCFGAAFVFECEALLTRLGANRHNGIIVLCETKPGQLILRADLHRSDPADQYARPKHAQMNFVEPGRM